MAEQTPRSAPPLDDSTRLDFERTRAAHEGTMMSWIRTSTSLGHSERDTPSSGAPWRWWLLD
jgi:hypothetical protein